jgi:hypothetical protein
MEMRAMTMVRQSKYPHPPKANYREDPDPRRVTNNVGTTIRCVGISAQKIQ